jgi:hypothetical protein
VNAGFVVSAKYELKSVGDFCSERSINNVTLNDRTVTPTNANNNRARRNIGFHGNRKKPCDEKQIYVSSSQCRESQATSNERNACRSSR